ncbi:MAG: RNA-binding protein [Candidatus Aenigmarchaeota archaeon]|nr:RNA-binding protein [Candidatus Aenigmarchaeota archaeon]
MKAAHGKIVIVRLKNNKNVSGIVEAYDMHLNLWLNDVEVTDTEGNTESFDKFLVRGDNVIYISPNLK